MAKLFGFKFEDDREKQSKKIVSPIPRNEEDKSDFYISSGFYGQYVDIEGVYKSEADLIRRYREMSLHPECDSAIEDVINEAIVSDLNDSPVESLILYLTLIKIKSCIMARNFKITFIQNGKYKNKTIVDEDEEDNNNEKDSISLIINEYSFDRKKNTKVL